MPTLEDGTRMWQLVQDSSLDDNSSYAYLMFARYYADTCVVAERRGELGGFVSAFQAPQDPEVLFVWQVGVGKSARGQGLATRMILDLAARKAADGVRYIEATVTPSNEASMALFHGLADKLGTKCEKSLCFPETVFPGDEHEEEWLLRIGPFKL